MAAAVLTPRVRMMTICDGIRESKAEAGVFHLKGVRQSITANAFPFIPQRLWLFLLLSSLRAGEFPCYVRVVNDRTNRTVFYSYLVSRPSFESAGNLSVHRAPLPCIFPEATQYTVQVWFFQEEGIDILKGEMTLTVKLREFET